LFSREKSTPALRPAALLVVDGHLRRRLIQLDLCAHLLDLRGLLFHGRKKNIVKVNPVGVSISRRFSNRPNKSLAGQSALSLKDLRLGTGSRAV